MRSLTSQMGKIWQLPMSGTVPAQQKPWNFFFHRIAPFLDFSSILFPILLSNFALDWFWICSDSTFFKRSIGHHGRTWSYGWGGGTKMPWPRFCPKSWYTKILKNLKNSQEALYSKDLLFEHRCNTLIVSDCTTVLQVFKPTLLNFLDPLLGLGPVSRKSR